MELLDKVFVAGHKGMVGSALVRELKAQGFTNVLTVDKSEVNLLDQTAVKDFMMTERPNFVFLAAARVGGIQANIDHPGSFLYENLQIQNNVIHHSYESGVDKLCFLGSSCIYPKQSPQPMKEEYLLTGPLEPTNEGYALAKIAGLKMCEFYGKQYGFKTMSLMPSNLYGVNDSFDPQHSHVLSALVRRFVDAVEENKSAVTMWGTGVARREFLNVKDLGRITIDLMRHHNPTGFMNIGSGTDISIKELAELIASKVGYAGEMLWDDTKPDGMLLKCMDVSRMQALGYEAQISLEAGIDEMIELYRASKPLSI